MRQTASLSVLFIVSLFVCGCVHTTATMLSSQQYPPLTPEEVTIYLSEDDISGEWERVAIINATGNAGSTNQQQMYDAVRRRAAQIGANGVLFQPIEEPSAGAQVAGAFLGTGTSRRAEMIAIYVIE